MKPVAAKGTTRRRYLGPEDVRCASCGVRLRPEAAIVPESSSARVFLCGLPCYEAWRASAPFDQRLCLDGDDLVFKE